MARTSQDLVTAVLGRPAPPSTAVTSPTVAIRPSLGTEPDAPRPEVARPATPATEKITMSVPAGCRRRYKVWCAEHGVTMSGLFHGYMEALLAGEAEPPRGLGGR